MRFLFNGDLIPLTNGFGFVKADFNEAVDCYNDWLIKYNINFKVTCLDTDFRNALLQLPPFQFYNRALLFRTNSEWVGYTNNNYFDAEIGAINNVGRLLKTETLQIKAHPPRNDLKSNEWTFGQFVYENFATCSNRVISILYDDRWDMDISGEPFSFEQVEKYKEKRVKDRFTPEMLNSYCKAMSVDFFNDKFYLGGESNLMMFSTERSLYDNEIPQALEEARKIYII